MSEKANSEVPEIGTRFRLTRFDDLKVSPESPYLIKGLIPRVGITVVWGPPKCGKSFLVADLALHVALGREYRGRKVRKGPVVYFAFEGAEGFGARAEAFRTRRLAEDHDPIDFYLVGAQADLVADHDEMIRAIRSNKIRPTLVVLDTLNRSLVGSESSDEDMAAYITAAEAICRAFVEPDEDSTSCAVIIVHHCGVDGTRPRGHTSLTGAVHGQIAVKRDQAKNVEATVEWLKDGPEGASFLSRLEKVIVGQDTDGDDINSCVVEPVEAPALPSATEKRLTANQQTFLNLLTDAGAAGLTVEEWNEQAREAGIGTKRKGDLIDLRRALVKKGLVGQSYDRWVVLP